MREEVVERVMARRRLGGPGSSPPSCRSKCGRCGPCQPVHVPIHPGFSMKLEYYPEAWRCKCRDKLFMP
ncbi:EPIDERMAL PATTERNING FACTOR-like protein [Perilla frutescens var. frutescens]|nr:EPIDERMAL PATTERNING FACTOR-like protein [Perilla frutescens var. frutescens]